MISELTKAGEYEPVNVDGSGFINLRFYEIFLATTCVKPLVHKSQTRARANHALRASCLAPTGI